MATHLVTGAAGFIGSRVCRMLLDAGHTVVGIDNLNDYYDVRLKDYRLSLLLNTERWRKNPSNRVSVHSVADRFTDGRFTFMPIDIENRPALEMLFREFKFECIFNLAARAGVRASLANPYVFLSTNTEGTLNLLECQRRFDVKRQVLASTSSLYAGSPMPFTEDLPVNTPLSPYAAAKKAAELMAYSYHRIYGLHVAVLRYFTVYGPAGRPDMAPFRFIKWIKEGTPITVFGDGKQSRDFTYVDDIARGTVAASALDGYEIINLGGGRTPVTLFQIIETIERIVGRQAVLKHSDPIAADMNATSADITKARNLLDWSPTVDVQEGFSRAVEWFEANYDWLQGVEI